MKWNKWLTSISYSDGVSQSKNYQTTVWDNILERLSIETNKVIPSKKLDVLNCVIEEEMLNYYGMLSPRELAGCFNIPSVLHLDVFNSTEFIELVKLTFGRFTLPVFLTALYLHSVFPLIIRDVFQSRYYQALEEREHKKFSYTINPDSIAKFFKPIERSETNENKKETLPVHKRAYFSCK